MDTTILRALRADAREWWWHRQLRQQGHVAEARALERADVRANVRTLRAATGWRPTGDGCTTIVQPFGCTVCGGYRHGKRLAALARERLPQVEAVA